VAAVKDSGPFARVNYINMPALYVESFGVFTRHSGGDAIGGMGFSC